jgi:hypothetical protein
MPLICQMPEPAWTGRAAATEAGEDLRVPGSGGGRLRGRRHSRFRLCWPHGGAGRHLLQGEFSRYRYEACNWGFFEFFCMYVFQHLSG